MGAIAAGIGMGLAGAVFGKPDTSNQTSTQTFQMAPWEESYWKNMTAKATQLANKPYVAYNGQRVAGLTNEQQSGINNAVENSRSWEDPYNQAAGAYSNVTSPFNGSDVNRYMSPYLGGVINNIERVGNENFSAPGGVADTISGDFTGLGQYGSKRMGDVMNRAGELNQRETQGAVANTLNAGYNTALDAYNADKNRELQAAAGLSSLAGQRQALETGTTNSLLGVGNLEQQQAQKNLDVGYQNYLDARDWQKNNLLAANQVRPPSEGTSTNTVPVPQPSPLQNFMSGVGMYNSGFFGDMFGGGSGGYIPSSGASTTPEMIGPLGYSPMMEKSGGRIPGYKRGGFIKRAIKHPGALHRMLHVPQGKKIPAGALHAAAEKGGVLGRRARFAEELESFHHSKGGVIAFPKRKALRAPRGALDALAA